MKKKNRRLLILLFLAISAGLGGGLTSCMKKPDMKPNYGPQVSIEEILSAINSEAPLDPFSIKSGQYVSIDETQVIDTQFPVLLSQRLDEVTNYQETETEVSLAFKVTLKELMGPGSWKESTQTYPPFTLTKPTAKSPTSSAAPASSSLAVSAALSKYLINEKSLPLTIQSLKTKDAASDVTITYHRLSREQGTMPIPDVIKSKPGCGGILRCDLPLRYLRVSFDRVVWDSPEHGIKTAYRFVYSPDIPVYVHDWNVLDEISLTNQFQSCAQLFLEISEGGQTQTVPILQCSEVRDFQFGKTN